MDIAWYEHTGLLRTGYSIQSKLNLKDCILDEEEKPQKRKSLASNVKGLIKRKDIIKQLQLGAQKLEQEQEMEENMQEESLENYTMGDLQKNIMNFAVSDACC